MSAPEMAEDQAQLLQQLCQQLFGCDVTNVTPEMLTQKIFECGLFGQSNSGKTDSKTATTPEPTTSSPVADSPGAFHRSCSQPCLLAASSLALDPSDCPSPRSDPGNYITMHDDDLPENHYKPPSPQPERAHMGLQPTYATQQNYPVFPSHPQNAMMALMDDGMGREEDDDDWESMMEITTTDEALKIQKLVDKLGSKGVTDPNQCAICRRVLSCKSALQMHYRTHTGERPYKCRVCSRRFTTKGNLKTHTGVHRVKPPLKPLGCKLCPKRFSSTLMLRQHIASHMSAFGAPQRPPAPPYGVPSFLPFLTGVPPPAHRQLMATVSENTSPNGHVSSQSPINWSCDRSVSSNSPHSSPSQSVSLNSDLRLNLPDRNPFNQVMLPSPTNSEGRRSGACSSRSQTTCNVCLKTFACASALNIHYRSHTKERPFACTTCSRAFSTKGNMKQHMLTHNIRDIPVTASTPSRPLQSAIEVCSPTEPVQDNAINTTHEDEKPASPTIKSELVIVEEGPQNADSSNPLKLIADMWPRRDPTPPRLQRPPNLSKHQCQLCYKHFSSASALQIHMRTHTGDKPFKCDVCDRAFTTKGNLKVHMGTHVSTAGLQRRGRRVMDFPFFGGMPQPDDPSLLTPSSEASGAALLALQSHQLGVGGLPPNLFPSSSNAQPMKSSILNGGDPRLLNPGSIMGLGGVHLPLYPQLLAAGLPLQALRSVNTSNNPYLWHNVCTVCLAVCPSPAALEVHLKSHLPNGSVGDVGENMEGTAVAQ